MNFFFKLLLLVVISCLFYRNAQTSQLSHPLPVLRAREVDEWSRSLEYRSLLKRANRISTLENV